ncbi:hypothetical protein EPH95_11275 [Salicibibacter halophilus]|uniref:Regulatory protein YycH domain-containing protein n=1 Tax=Salicibibacter halophilus TaxID=2502791 RepID=A0A514LIK7_9BACI|nr:two-component system activity regulator YycH [Salicibibacter halophilus]QDI91679.1 hypothetical protein EPH95_11275 [Salicibibacter halophilus]
MKNVILTILVITSLILTWQLWTYQPELGFLDEESVEESEQLSDQVELADVVGPANVVFHRDNEQWTTSHGSLDFIDEIATDVFSSEWGDLELLEGVGQDRVYESDEDKIEFVLPAPLPLSMVENWLEDDQSLPVQEDLFTFERLLMIDEGGALRVQLVSFDDQQILEGYIDMEIEAFQAHMEQMDGSSVSYATEAHVGEDNEELQKPVYLPAESVSYPQLQFTSTNIDEDALLPYLFPDRDSVVTPDTGGGEQLYHSSDRQMRVSQFGNYIEFDYPQNEVADQRDEQIIANAYAFVNAHGGFTNSYQLYDWNVSGGGESAKFRMLVDGLPVLDTHASWYDFSSINVTQQNDVISSYERPAFMFDEHEPLDDNPDEQMRELPDGESVLAEVEESNNLDFDDIEGIRVGYELERVDTYIYVVPYWYAESDGSWIQLDNGDQEGELSGLE